MTGRKAETVGELRALAELIVQQTTDCTCPDDPHQNAMHDLAQDLLDALSGDPCCDLHNRNCEPPSELCCEHCTEAAHPGHADGSTCIAPDLSALHERHSRMTHRAPESVTPR